ncbi:helix-turn-helix domain-containing protein [Phenylobacterium sp. Root700]|uniref:helix-turn-helix domain-containing protein n=1 Tax=Phenylobacterium sp. Root700 TaxID=1736591 RepID=UPI0009E71A4B|nr:helix-turn-helix domain-containing protein [Phenylobacterium sp. Root700]
MPSPSVFITTEQVEPEHRNDFWREVTRPAFETRAVDDQSPLQLEGSLIAHAVGALIIGPTSFNAQRNTRERRLIVAGGLDQCMVQLFLQGQVQGDCDGAAYRAGPGDICIRDLARPFDSTVSLGATITLVLPRERIARRLGGHIPHGYVLLARDPLTRLLADFLTSLSELAPELDDADALALEDAAVDLVATVVMRKNPALVETPTVGRVLRPRILAFIDQHLFEPALGPKLLLERFQVSRAHLYRMFEADGGVVSVIRGRRLDAALRELSQHNPAGRSITALSHDLGFSSSSQFSRAFRARFDCTPTDVLGGRRPPWIMAADGADLRGHFAQHARAGDR